MGFNPASNRTRDLWKENEGEQQGSRVRVGLSSSNNLSKKTSDGSVQQLGFSLVPDVVELATKTSY